MGREQDRAARRVVGRRARLVRSLAAVAAGALAAATVVGIGRATPPAGAALPIHTPDATVALDAGTPRVIRVDPSTGRLWIGIGDEIEVLNANGTVHGRVPSMFGINAMAIVGRTLYVDLPGVTKIAAIDLDTATVTHQWSLAPYTKLYGLAYSSGKLWFTATPASSSLGTLVSLDVATGTVASTTVGQVYGIDYLTSDPNGSTILMAEADIEPATLRVIDVSGTPTQVGSQWDVSENLAQISLSPDGQTAWVAGGAPYHVNEYSAATALPTGVTYTTSNYPVAVTGFGAYLASASAQASTANNVWIFKAGEPTPVWLGEVSNDYTSEPMDAGVAASPAGDRLYVVQMDGSLRIFNLDIGPPGAPGTPVGTPGAGSVTLSWSAPAHVGSSPVSGYVVTPYVGGVAQPARTFTSAATVQTITGLTPGTSYTFRVAAVNGQGTGVASAASAPVLVPVPPGAPTIGVATAHSGGATLSWSAPASTGGAPVLHYRITPHAGATALPGVQTAGPQTSASVEGLTNGTAYTFTVAAVNAAGTGAESAASNAVSPASTAPERFVLAAYADFLGRPPSVTELDQATAGLTNGTLSRGQVLSGLASSTAWVSANVNHLYQDTLGRPGEASGVAYWTNQIRLGRQTVAQVAASFYASPEYFTGIGGGTVDSWLTDLYTKLLGRAADAGGLGYWRGQVTASSRTSVAFRFFQSSESCHARVAALYAKLLGRAPDAGGWDYWAQTVGQRGDIALAASLAGSLEYYQRAQTRFP